MAYKISRKSTINDNTTSTSKTTGALTVKGGISSQDNIYSGGFIGITGTTNSVGIKVQPSTNSYNFNLPTISGNSGDILTSGGGGSTPMSWTSTTGTGNVVLSSGPVFGSGGITSTAGTNILGPTTIGTITGTSASFSSTLSSTGLITANGGLTSTAGTTTLGATTIGAITGTSASFSSTLSATGLITASGGLTSTAGTTTLGTTTIGAITGTSATFSSTLGVTGLATFGAGGLTSTSGTTTLGTTSIGAITGMSATFSSTLGVTGLATFGAGGLTSTAGTTTLGSTTLGAITGTSATFSSTLGVTGLATFGAGGLTSTAGTTTLGTTTIGALTGTSATLSSSTTSSSKTTGALTVVGGISTQENLNVGGYIGLSGSTSGLISIRSQTSSGTYNFNLPTTSGSSGQVLTSAGGGSSPMTWTTPTTGTVTSVDLSAPSFLSVTGNPITTSGTIALSYSGTALPIANGGTGATTFNLNSVLLGSTSGAIQSPTSITYSSNTLTLPRLVSNDGTASTSNTTGGLTLNGGLGISNTTDATSTTNGGSITTAGGLAVGKNIFTSGNINIIHNSNPVITIGTSGGGSGTIYLGNSNHGILRDGNNITMYTAGSASLRLQNDGITNLICAINTTQIISNSATASTSNTTGGLTLNGGLGISNTTDATSTTNGGSITTAGGVAIAKQLKVGTNIDTASINIRNTGGTYGAGSIYSDSSWGMIFRSAVNSPTIATYAFSRFDDVKLLYMYDNGLVNIPGTASSTSNSTGILTLGGGLGISNTTDATSVTNGGSITTAGGLAVAKKAYFGSSLNFTSNTLAIENSNASTSESTTRYTTTFGPSDLNSINASGITYFYPNLYIKGSGNNSNVLFGGATHNAGDIIIQGGMMNDSANNGTGSQTSNAGNVYIRGGVAFVGDTLGNNAVLNNGKIIFEVGTSFTGSSTSFSTVEAMRINPGGNVGIGTNSPGSSLHVAGLISVPSGNGVHMGIDGGGVSSIQLNSTISLIDFSTSGVDHLGRILYNTTINSMSFSTNTGERMRINSSGDIGIGTSSPGYRLDVNGTIGSVGLVTAISGIRVNGNSNITQQGAHLQWNRTGGDGETWLINTTVGNDPGIRFAKSTLSNSLTELMRIQDNGNVSIGTTSSTSRLTVRNDTNGETKLLLQNSNNGSLAYSITSVASDSATLEMLVNSSTRTIDGGASGASIRNPNGTLTLGTGGRNTIFPGTITADRKMQCGITTGNLNYTGTVTFPVAFDSTPYITLTVVNPNTNNVYLAELTASSSTSFSFIKRFQNQSGGAWSNADSEIINWIAIV